MSSRAPFQVLGGRRGYFRAQEPPSGRGLDSPAQLLWARSAANVDERIRFSKGRITLRPTSPQPGASTSQPPIRNASPVHSPGPSSAVTRVQHLEQCSGLVWVRTWCGTIGKLDGVAVVLRSYSQCACGWRLCLPRHASQRALCSCRGGPLPRPQHRHGARMLGRLGRGAGRNLPRGPESPGALPLTADAHQAASLPPPVSGTARRLEPPWDLGVVVPSGRGQGQGRRPAAARW